MFTARSILVTLLLTGSAYASPPTLESGSSPAGLSPEQIFLTACEGSHDKSGIAPGLFQLKGTLNGRNHYGHVIQGMKSEIWFGEPARAPDQLVIDHDDKGPRTGPRWLMGTGPEDTWHQAFVDNDDPRPPASGWTPLFSATITSPCLVLGPSHQPAQTMPLGVLGIALDVPVSFRQENLMFGGWQSVSYMDAATGTRWWVERRNSGIAFADPPDMTLRRGLRQAKGVTKLREVKKGPIATPRLGIPLPPRRTVFLYRHGEASYCDFYAHGGSYTLWTMGPKEGLAEREALLERMCVGHVPGTLGFEGTVAEHLERMMTTLPSSPVFQGLERGPGLLRFHDTSRGVWIKMVWRTQKGGSPYNDATDDNIRRRLNDQGCNARRARPGKLGERSGWRARCEMQSPLDAQKRVNVFTFASRGENVWLVTLWGEDMDWKTIEAHADSLFDGVRLH